MQAPKKTEPGLLLQILMPLVMLASVGLVLVLVVRPGGAPSPLVIGGIVVLLFAWIGVSVLWPARADRSCPDCKQPALVRIDPTSAVGLRCTACAWNDTTASGWYLAEEELEALEPLALEQRRRKALAKGAGMDTGNSAH